MSMSWSSEHPTLMRKSFGKIHAVLTCGSLMSGMNKQRWVVNFIVTNPADGGEPLESFERANAMVKSTIKDVLESLVEAELFTIEDGKIVVNPKRL